MKSSAPSWFRAIGHGHVLVWLLVLGPASSLADEGMWPFHRLPLDQLRERHGFTPPPGWAERLMRASVRLSSGGSGSFVSPEGLVLTNHHVGSDALQKLSTPERNLMVEGFVARSRGEEMRCPDLEVVALVSIEDVTRRVEAAVPAGADPGAANKARREAIATIEKESLDQTGLQSEVVVLYQGAEYHLYRYRRYEDVRLVMAPESAIAFFGGDADNFEYPRFCLDVCFFRVYEDQKPARIEHYLPLEAGGLDEGELVFVSGHPGRTQRQFTVDHLRYLRDQGYPDVLDLLYRREITLQQFSLEGAEEARIAKEELFGIENARKAYRGIVAGLLDPAVLRSKAADEAALRARVAADRSLGAGVEDWSRIQASRQALRELQDDYLLLERGRAFWSKLYDIARTLVRLAEEKEKPNAERLPGFRESDMASLELRLYSPAPIHAALERAQLADSLAYFAVRLGAEHPLVELVLAGRSPGDRAAELVQGTKLASPEARREVAAGGVAAIRASSDPMIVLARTVDPYARAARRKYEDLVEGVERDAYARIARARFAVSGTSVYPDATFTLRLAFGEVRGLEDAGVEQPHTTDFRGLFERYERMKGKEAYELPARWMESRSKLDLSTSFNFVSTADIIGGNSGSPVVDRRGRLVGVIFDGNIHTLVWDLYYSDAKGRAIAVAAPAIVEALRKVYRADALVAELGETPR